MSRPRFLVENFYDQRTFPAHGLSANEAEVGHEAFRVGTYRRSARNYWSPTTANQDAWVRVDATESKSADTLVIDRNHNLGGETIRLQTSPDDAAWSDVFSLTFPTTVSTGTDLETTPGALMDDGAWGFFFGATSSRYWRVLVDAMGAGERPRIGGLYLGSSYQPNLHLGKPWSWGLRRLEFDTSRSDTAWVSASRPARRREATLNFFMDGEAEYDDDARYHIEELYLSKTPMWVFPDTDHGERGWLAMPETGTAGFRFQDGWGFLQGAIPAVEHEPELL